VPVCVAAKNIEDGRYIFANRAFERFSRFSRITSSQARRRDFRPDTAPPSSRRTVGLNAREGYFATNFTSSGLGEGVLASKRVIAPNENNEPDS